MTHGICAWGQQRPNHRNLQKPPTNKKGVWWAIFARKCIVFTYQTLGILAHLLRMVSEPKYLSFRWLYTPIIWRSVSQDPQWETYYDSFQVMVWTWSWRDLTKMVFALPPYNHGSGSPGARFKDQCNSSPKQVFSTIWWLVEKGLRYNNLDWLSCIWTLRVRSLVSTRHGGVMSRFSAQLPLSSSSR